MRHYEGQRLVNTETGLKLEVQFVKKRILICRIIIEDTNPMIPVYKVEKFPMGELPVIRLLSKRVADKIYLDY